MKLVKTRTAYVYTLIAVIGIVIVAMMAAAQDPFVGAQEVAASPNAEKPFTGPIDAQTFRLIANAQAPMVVNIRTESRRQTADLSEFFEGDDLWDRFFGLPQPRLPQRPRDQITEGAGSGFIVDKSGLILTNHHVIDGATKIAVALYGAENGREYEAKVIGRDPLTDSALMQLTEMPEDPLPTATLGRSSQVQPGDWVMAIGNPFNLTHTVTVGVISAVGRPFPISEGRWQDVLQTDAAINPGNSGGPLLNVRGEVIGINTAIFSTSPYAGNVGVGFAVPIDTVRELLPDLRRGNVTRGRIGVRITPITDALVEPLGLLNNDGALVRMVERDGPAHDAGIEPGDVIVEYNGAAVDDSDDLSRMVARTKPGTTVSVRVIRDKASKTHEITVAALESATIGNRADAADDGGFGLTLRNVSEEVARRLDLPSGQTGALVTEVAARSAAARAGLRPGDVIIEVNGRAVDGAAEAARTLRSGSNDTALVLVWRDGQRVFLTMTKD